MIANIVNNLQMWLTGGLTEASAELLHPNYRRFRWSQHQHRIDVGDVDPFIEHVYGKNDLEFAACELLQRRCPWRTFIAGMAGSNRTQCIASRHVFGIAPGHFPHVLRLRRPLLVRSGQSESSAKGCWCNQPNPDPPILERAKQIRRDAIWHGSLKHEVFLAKSQEIATVHPFGRCRQAKQKFRLEMIDDSPIGPGRGMMEFIDDDVVKSDRVKAIEVLRAAQGLHRREKQVRIDLPLRRSYTPYGRLRSNTTEIVYGLI